MSTTPDKTSDIAVLDHAAITHPGTLVGSVQDVSAKIAAGITLFHAAVEAVANTNPGVFHIQVSNKTTGTEDWVTRHSVSADSGTPATEVMTATEPVGEKVLAVASTAGFAASDGLYIQDAGTVDNSEWALCQEITGTPSINLIDGLTTEKDSSDVIWNNANKWNFDIDLSGVDRLRVIFMHEGATGANCHVKALMTTLDSFTAA